MTAAEQQPDDITLARAQIADTGTSRTPKDRVGGVRATLAIAHGVLAIAEAATRIADAFEAANQRNRERDADWSPRT